MDKWDEIPLMGQRRAGAGATVSGGKIYVAGGFDDNAPLSSVEVYDPRARQVDKEPYFYNLILILSGHLYLT